MVSNKSNCALVARCNHYRIKSQVIILILLSLVTPGLLACNDAMAGNKPGKKLLIANFSKGDLLNWQKIDFSGLTEYQISNIDATIALRATSNSSASGIVCKQRVDLYKTPILKWQWRVDEAVTGADEKQKAKIEKSLAGIDTKGTAAFEALKIDPDKEMTIVSRKSAIRRAESFIKQWSGTAVEQQGRELLEKLKKVET